jgi:malate dehydrogenase (oxaloacetate-decarboxylating)(NADP+)
MAYGGKALKMGPDYFIPKPFDPRVLWWVAPAVARAAMDSGVARIKFDIGEYREKLMSKGSNAAYSIMRTIGREARREPKRIVYPHAANPRLLRAVQQIAEEGIARPVLLGRHAEIEHMCNDMSLDMLSRGVEIVDPRDEKDEAYIERLWQLRQRKGITRDAAKALIQKSDYYAALMVDRGDADGVVTGLRLNYPDTVRPLLEIFGLAPGSKVAVGMYMMVLKNSVKFFADTVFNIDPDAETLADITLQTADAVQSFGITPRVAMISYSNFGAVKHPSARKLRDAIEIVRKRRPDLEIDGEMQPEIAFDNERRNQYYPFSRLSRSANTLVFPYLDPANAAYQTLKVLGGASAVGPILVGLSKPCAALQNEVTVEDIVNMTAYVVLKAQQQTRAREARRA